MSTTTTLISGDEAETCVFAVCFSDNLCLTFRFCRDTSLPTSINNRIVTCFHEIEVKDETESFSEQESMREAIRSAVAHVWQACESQPSVHLPDVIIQIAQEPRGDLTWTIIHESSFEQYLTWLLPVETVKSKLLRGSKGKSTPCASIDSLKLSYVLGGRGGTTKTTFKDAVNGKAYVFKGLSFRLFLELGSAFKNERDAFYREVGVISSLPHDPHLIGPPHWLIATESPQIGNTMASGGKSLICGYLQPFQEHQSIQEVIEKENVKNQRISLSLKAKWASQISSAMEEVHRSGQFHMDLKPSNILLDQQEGAIIIDWEQYGASPFFLAPEANGAWDVNFIPSIDWHSGDSRKDNLVYSAYTGPQPEDRGAWPERNVFHVWHEECSLALEAAEVYSLGKTLWAIFEQMDQKNFEISRSSWRPVPVVWSATAADIPSSWKDFILCLTEDDPKKRPSFADAFIFWVFEIMRMNL